jgi:hypothetical protein
MSFTASSLKCNYGIIIAELSKTMISVLRLLILVLGLSFAQVTFAQSANGGEAGGAGCLGQTNFIKMWNNIIDQLFLDYNAVVADKNLANVLKQYKTKGDILRSAAKKDGIIICTGEEGLPHKEINGSISKAQAITIPLTQVKLADKFFENVDRPGICTIVYKEMNRFLGGVYFENALLESSVASNIDCTKGISRPPGTYDITENNKKSNPFEITYSVRFERTNENKIRAQLCTDHDRAESATCKIYAEVDYNEIDDYLANLNSEVPNVSLGFTPYANLIDREAAKVKAKKQLTMLVLMGVPACVAMGIFLPATVFGVVGPGLFVAGIGVIFYNVSNDSIKAERDFLFDSVKWIKQNFVNMDLQPGAYLDLELNLNHFKLLNDIANKTAKKLNLEITENPKQPKISRSFINRIAD